jgi:hypothetical protein
MEDATAESVMRFDLTEVGEKLNPLTSRKRRVLTAMLIFLVAFGLLFVAGDASAIATHSLPLLQAVDLVIVLVGVTVTGVVGSLPLGKLKKSAILLSVDGLGFELAYPDRRSVRAEWGDPALEFDLMDSSDVNPSKLLSGVPYSITVRGVRSLLTHDAYVAMSAQVARRELLDSVGRGSRWVYSTDANPIIRQIRAPDFRVRNRRRA